MSQADIEEFMRQTGVRSESTASHYLQSNFYNVEKAVNAYKNIQIGKKGKGVEWFAGGNTRTGDGVALLSRPDDDPNFTPLDGNAKPAPEPIAAPEPVVRNEQLVPANTDHSIEGQPKLKVRIEIEDLAPITMTISNSQTVGELKQFLTLHRPTLQGKKIDFVVKPNRPLTDDSKTAEEEHLKMAMIKCTHN